MFYAVFKTILFRPVVKYLFGATVVGVENIPATGGVILASNHLSAGDTFILPSMIDRQVTLPAKAELVRGNRGLGSRIVAWFLKAVGQVPLDRSGGKVSMAGLGPVLEVLNAGGTVGIYPEGTRSPDGRLYRGKTGVARIALAAGVPVVPVAMFDTLEVRGFAGIPWIHKPRIVIGEPLDFSAYVPLAEDHAVVRWVTDEVMAAIQQVSGQEYVDLYASAVKYGTLSESDIAAKALPRPGEGSTPPQVPPAIS
ncbi:MAG: lysophospholipid acyltransferase family protein [Propionicimonas sp.]|nr:lysophospholipid acyltransferase family protein [Propionicimonas sp.]